MRPVIGITGNLDSSEELVQLKSYYIKSINSAGGTALVLPPTRDDTIMGDYLSICQGLVISGGGDIDPHYWGESPAIGLGDISPLRDSFELALAAKVRAVKRPVLGICRGCQVLNVAAGGSVIQDIVSPISHMQNAPRWYPFHDIVIDKYSCLAAIVGSQAIRVNSFHHQAVGQPGSGIRITACALDGTIEAIEDGDHPFYIGVQWHPECMNDQASGLLFSALIKVCQNHGPGMDTLNTGG
ncbi:MAG: gamma-glutamyl-gamma-aminobutyrate hydrolase family protein [Syntrophomonadaceae bacterium]|jgi:putative glutamine amidotransferase